MYIKTILLCALFLLVSCENNDENGALTVPGNSSPAFISDLNIDAILNNLVESVSMSLGTIIGPTIIIDKNTGMSYTAHDNACFSGVVNLTYDLDNLNLVSGQSTYIDYDNCFAVSINGGAQLQGTLFNSTSTIDYIILQLNNIQVSRLTDGKIFSINGSMDLNWNSSVNGASGYTLILDVTVSDPSTNHAYRFDGLKVVVTLAAGVNYAMLSGRFYHSQHGYVDINTISAVRYDQFNAAPSNGALNIIGADQIANVIYNGFMPTITISTNP